MQASIEQLVDFLKDDLMFVNVFVLTFKESDKRLTLGLQSMMKLLGTVLFYLDLLISYQSIITMHCALHTAEPSQPMVRERLDSGRMFGSQFWRYSVICGTQWGYDTRRIEMRNSSDYNEHSWTAQINKLLTGLQGKDTSSRK